MVSAGRHPLRNPTVLVALLLGGQITAWTLAPTLAHSAPPLDVVEGYMWGREWVLATYKHPALPSWALEASRLVTGAIGWPAYLLSQAAIATTFLFVYLLGRELMGASRAAAGTLLLTGVAFFAWPTTQFNHNVAEMPIWAAMSWVLWRALKEPSLPRWLTLGALAALGMYAKFASALLLVTMAAWMVWDRTARPLFLTPGPWLGLLVFAVLLAPLINWLFANDFAPLHYAAIRSASGRRGLISFILSMALNLIGVAAMLLIAGLIGPRAVGQQPSGGEEGSVDPRATAYLATLTFGPLAITLAEALIAGTSLRSAWGSTMFNFVGLLAMALTAKRFSQRALKRIAACAGALLIIVPIGYGVVVLVLPRLNGTHMRVAWPQAEISRRMAAIWANETGQPLGIVGGDDWIAGLIGISAKDQPSLLIKGELALSPWISAERLHRQGMLVVWNTDRERIPPALKPLVAARITRQERLRWRSGDARELAIGYVIIPPNQAP